MPTRRIDRKYARLAAVKRIFVDYTRIGHAEVGHQFRTRLHGSEREGLESGVVVIVEGDSIPDRLATFMAFDDDHRARLGSVLRLAPM